MREQGGWAASATAPDGFFPPDMFIVERSSVPAPGSPEAAELTSMTCSLLTVPFAGSRLAHISACANGLYNGGVLVRATSGALRSGYSGLLIDFHYLSEMKTVLLTGTPNPYSEHSVRTMDAPGPVVQG